MIDKTGNIIGAGDRALKMLGYGKEIFELNFFNLMIKNCREKIVKRFGLNKENLDRLFQVNFLEEFIKFSSILVSKKKLKQFKEFKIQKKLKKDFNQEQN